MCPVLHVHPQWTKRCIHRWSSSTHIFSIVHGVICLLATYYTFYVKYPKPIVANSFILFLQEIVLGSKVSYLKQNVLSATMYNTVIVFTSSTSCLRVTRTPDRWGCVDYFMYKIHGNKM